MIFKLFLTFFKIGLFTFGGGYAMIVQIKEYIVAKEGWLTDDELTEIIAIAESTPGPIAINMATYVGYKKKGVLGSIAATAGVVVPSFVIIFIISLFLEGFMNNKYVSYAFVGIKAAVAFLILRAGVDLFKKVEKKLLPLICFGAVFATMILFDVLAVSFSSVFYIIIGGVVGIVAYALIGIGKNGGKQ